MPEITPTDFIALLTLEKSVDDLKRVIDECNEILKRQNQMLDIALDLMLKLADDESTDPQIRRRLVFALQQIKGIGLPS